MTKTYACKLLCAVTLTLAGLTACIAGITLQWVPATFSSGTNQCGGYYAYAKMTNSAGALWITPTNGTITGTFQDASGFPSPYVSAVVVKRKSDGVTWFTNNNNLLTFPASSSNSYSLVVYVNSTPPPPTNGQAMTLQVNWQ